MNDDAREIIGRLSVGDALYLPATIIAVEANDNIQERKFIVFCMNKEIILTGNDMDNAAERLSQFLLDYVCDNL